MIVYNEGLSENVYPHFWNLWDFTFLSDSTVFVLPLGVKRFCL